MTATLADVRKAMADQLVAAGINAVPYVMSNPNPPCAQVVRGLTEYDQAMGNGVETCELNVRVYVAEVSDIAGSMRLDEFLDTSSDSSVKSALESDSTLGGLVSDLHVYAASEERVYVRDNGGPLLGSEFQVTVWL